MEQFCVSKFEIRNLAYTKLCNDFIFYIFSISKIKKGKNESVPKIPQLDINHLRLLGQIVHQI